MFRWVLAITTTVILIMRVLSVTHLVKQCKLSSHKDHNRSMLNSHTTRSRYDIFNEYENSLSGDYLYDDVPFLIVLHFRYVRFVVILEVFLLAWIFMSMLTLTTMQPRDCIMINLWMTCFNGYGVQSTKYSFGS